MCVMSPADDGLVDKCLLGEHYLVGAIPVMAAAF